jgi:DNA-binding MarR family transcriptional regulator
VSDRKLTAKAAITAKPPASGADPARRNGRKAINAGVLNEHLGYFIRRAQVWVFQDFMRKLASIDIRPAQYSVMIVIGENPGLSQSDLADALNIERARLVHVLDKLEKRGLTERQASPVDRRSHALHLTREGQKMLKRAKALAAEHEAELSGKLGADNRRMMIEALREFVR